MWFSFVSLTISKASYVSTGLETTIQKKAKEFALAVLHRLLRNDFDRRDALESHRLFKRHLHCPNHPEAFPCYENSLTVVAILLEK